jgi:DNA-binding TFAR19-related protein (PDSD5 family)
MINKIIRNFVAKQMAGRADDGIMITLKDPQRVTLAENIMADLLIRNGIDPRIIKSEDELKMILQQIENARVRDIQNTGIRNTESAKVFDLEGKEIPPGSKIMGGKAVDDDLPPPGSRGGDEDIAAPVQSSEESLRDMMIAENKKTVNKIKQRQKMLAEAIDNQSPSLSGDRKVDADIVAEDLAERMGLVYDDMPTKERLKLYDEAYQALTKKKFDPPEDLATGGRVGLRSGTGKRFLQKVFGKEGFEEMKSRDPEMYVGLLEVVDMYRKRDKEGLKMYLQKFLPHMDDAQIEDFIRGSDGSEGLIGELIRLGSGRDYQGKIEMMKRSEEMKKLRDLEVTDDMIRKPNADGGIMRLGLKEGSGMSRRTFLKFLAGAASIPIVGKIFKPLKIGKTVTKVPIIKTDNVPGKPEWFDQLVNKVILEGDDVSKRFATKDREIVHIQKT